MYPVSKKDSLMNFFEDQTLYRNNSCTRSNRNLSKRKLARFIASLICQAHEIENKLIAMAERKNISSREHETIKSSCELYKQMLVLINEWKDLHFQNQVSEVSRRAVNPWSAEIFNESLNQDRKLIV